MASVQVQLTRPGDRSGFPTVHLPWEPYEDLKRFNIRTWRVTIRLALNSYTSFSRFVQRRLSVFSSRTTTSSEKFDMPEMGLPSPAPTQTGRAIPMLRMSWSASKGSLPSQDPEARPQPQRRFSAASNRSNLQVQTTTGPKSLSMSHFPTSGGFQRPEPHLKWKKVASEIGRSKTLQDTLSKRLMPSNGRNRLKSLRFSEKLVPETGQGSVRDLKFAPDGKWLAATFTDGTAGLWEVRDDFVWHSSLPAHSGRIEWSPDSSCLLTKLEDCVLLWTPGVSSPKDIPEVPSTKLPL